MRKTVPRVMITGVRSGNGKTTVVCGILQALVNRRMKPSAFKCGPDYIDPMFHRNLLGLQGGTLDSFFFREQTLKALMVKESSGSDMNIIEGAMGFYDGIGMTARASAFEIAQITETPVILVVDVKGSAFSALAEIQGFLTLYPNSRICGVLLNRCSSSVYPLFSSAIEKRFGNSVKLLGFLPVLHDCAFPSRYLGLKTADEIPDLKQKLQNLAKQTEETVNLDLLLEIAGNAPELEYQPISVTAFGERVKIGVAEDQAFCFYYRENLDLLKEMGAELVSFSPLHDPVLPEGLHGIYFGGGYPELYAKELNQNVSMRQSVKEKLREHLPCIAECGGFMYLTEQIGEWEMVGFLPGKCFDTGSLRRFGYLTLQAKEENLLSRAGETIGAHEFHYWDTDESGSSFTAAKPNGKTWDCMIANRFLYAGFPHVHFYSNPCFAENFYQACIREKKNHDEIHQIGRN